MGILGVGGIVGIGEEVGVRETVGVGVEVSIVVVGLASSDDPEQEVIKTMPGKVESAREMIIASWFIKISLEC